MYMRQFWKIGVAAFVLLAIAGTAAGIVAAQTGGSTPDATSTQEQSTATKDATSTTKNAATATPKSGDITTPKSNSSATPTTKDQRRDDFLNGLAGKLGISRADLDKALSQTALDMVDKALADGKITDAEAQQIRDRINSGDFPFFGGFGHHGRGGMGMFCRGANLDDIAGFLKVDTSVVHDGLMNNQSLAQIAEAHGKSRDDLKSFLISNVTDKLNQAVKNQDITQARADQALQNLKDNVDNLIDHQGAPFRGGGFRGHGGYEGQDNDNGNTPAAPQTPGNSTTTSSLTL
jgi:uncharacterized protein YidB (DUF937 family)